MRGPPFAPNGDGLHGGLIALLITKRWSRVKWGSCCLTFSIPRTPQSRVTQVRPGTRANNERNLVTANFPGDLRDSWTTRATRLHRSAPRAVYFAPAPFTGEQLSPRALHVVSPLCNGAWLRAVYYNDIKLGARRDRSWEPVRRRDGRRRGGGPRPADSAGTRWEPRDGTGGPVTREMSTPAHTWLAHGSCPRQFTADEA